MSTPPERAAPRREFLVELAAASLAVAGAACAHGPAPRVATAPAPAPKPASGRVLTSATSTTPVVAAGAAGAATHFDDSWTTRVAAAKHKAVFDSPEIEDGRVFDVAYLYRDGYQKALGALPADVVPVLVLRHIATVLAFDDAFWAKYPVARLANVRPSDAKKKDAWPLYNPYARPHTELEKSLASYLLQGALAAGTVVLACNTALQGFTARLARETGVDVNRVRDEARAGLVRGVILQPSGIYATLRAQEVGCTFMRV